LKRDKDGKIIGLYSPHNYLRLTRIMTFLNLIDLHVLSALVFLCLCSAMSEDKEFYKKVLQYDSLQCWKNTQGYIPKEKKVIPLPKIIDNIWEGDEDEDDEEEEEYEEEEYEEEDEQDEEVAKYKDREIHGLEWTGNSCYQDSILLALFALPIKELENEILYKDLTDISSEPKRTIVCSKDKKKDLEYRTDIQKELRRIVKSIRGKKNVKTCSNLRKLFKKCGKADFHTTRTQDATDFLQYIFNLFDVKSGKIPIQTIFPYMAGDRTSTQEILNNYPDDNFEIYTSSYFIFAVSRTGYDEKRKKQMTHKFTVFPNEKITLSFATNLSLHSIIIHRSNHYTCYIRINGSWYYYDDTMSTKPRYIGTFKDMIKSDPNPTQLGTLFFYQ